MPVPKLEEYRAPWETEAGEDTEINPEKLKKYIHGLLVDKDRAQTKVTEVTTERDTLKQQLAAKPDGNEDVEALKTELAETKEELAKAPSPTEVLRLQVALSKGLTENQAKRLLGDTKEDLEKDADELLESFGGAGNGAEEDESDNGARRHPQRPRTGGDPDPDAGRPLDIDKALESIPRIGGI